MSKCKKLSQLRTTRYPEDSWDRIETLRLCSFRGLGSNSQNPQGDSQPPVTPVPEYQVASSGLQGHKTLMWYVDIHVSKTCMENKETPQNLGMSGQRTSGTREAVAERSIATL